MDMHFWGTIAVLFVLTCAMGRKLDRKRKGAVRGHAGEAMDARANEVLMGNRKQGGPNVL
jgi:hypothetical protein